MSPRAGHHSNVQWQRRQTWQ